jgi:hypothetical protein
MAKPIRIYTSRSEKDCEGKRVHRMTTRIGTGFEDEDPSEVFAGPTVYRRSGWKHWWISCCSRVNAGEEEQFTNKAAVRWLDQAERELRAQERACQI